MLKGLCDGINVFQSCNSMVDTGCGHLYIITDYHESKVVRVEAVLGKEGCCTRCLNSALSRAITIGINHGVPLGEYVRELRGYQCEKPNMFPKDNRVLSCPDGIAKALEEVACVLGIEVQNGISRGQMEKGGPAH